MEDEDGETDGEMGGERGEEEIRMNYINKQYAVNGKIFSIRLAFLAEPGAFYHVALFLEQFYAQRIHAKCIWCEPYILTIFNQIYAPTNTTTTTTTKEQ